MDTANSYGFYDAPDSINEARGFSVVVDPFSRDDIYGNPIHIYYSEYHLAPNIPGYGFFDQSSSLPQITDTDVYNLGVLEIGTYEIISENSSFTTFQVMDHYDNTYDPSNFTVSEAREYHLIIAGEGTYQIELNQLSGENLIDPPTVINSPTITGLSSNTVYENVSGGIVGLIYAHDNEDGNTNDVVIGHDLTFLIENELDGNKFEIGTIDGSTYLKLASGYQADYRSIIKS